MSIIEFSGVSFTYPGGINALDYIDLKIDKGSKTAIIGANGAGKSTMLKSVTGITLPTKGSITVNGLEVKGANLPAIRKAAGYLLQDSDNQLFTATVTDDIIFAPMNYGEKRENALKEAKELLEKLGISHLDGRRNHTLSGGEKKMASIAVVLAMKPDIVLMDEPTASLDPKNRRMIITTVNAMTQTVLVATHDLDFALDTCERTVIMNKGSIVADGPTKEILGNRALLEANDLELPLKYQ